MGDMGEMWNDIKAARQAKRASNRHDSAQILRDAGVQFVERNQGAHLIVNMRGHTVDFWPGTGLWRMRGSTQKHRGVRNLLKLVKGKEEST